MSERPAVSVIMPAYRAAETIAMSVQSVQAQSLSDWELVIVDDGSPDDTAQIAASLARTDERIRVVRQSNQGPSAARNHGVRHARSDVLSFLDADDFWAPERLAGMLETLVSHPSVGVLFSRTRFVDSDTLTPGTLTPFIRQLSARDIMAENAVCSTSNIVCRKRVFEQTGGFSEDLHYAEDQDWLLRVALAGQWQIRGVDAEWFFYRSSSTSQSADLEAMRRGWFRMIESAGKSFPEATHQALRHAIGPIHRQFARRALRLGRPETALRYLRIALSRDPALLLRQPRRTALTIAGAVVALIPHPKLREFIAR